MKGLEKGYLCWLLCGKHKQKQNHPAVTLNLRQASLSQLLCQKLKCLLSHGFTPQTFRWHIRPDKQLETHHRNCEDTKQRDAVRHITQEDTHSFLALSYPNSLNTFTDIDKNMHTTKGHLQFLRGFYSCEEGRACCAQQPENMLQTWFPMLGGQEYA